MLGRLRRFDVQATYAVVLSIASIVPFLATAALFLRNLHWDLRQIIYNSNGFYLPVFLGCALFTLLLAAPGLALGWSSAGKRRNDLQGRSWIGFFVGGIVLTLDTILLIAFFMLRLQQSV